MKAKDQFIEWLRETILQNPQEPPAEAWQEISDALDLEESWEKIGEELELNTIWDKIGTRLDTYGTILKYERLGYAFSGVVALVFLLGVVWVDPLFPGVTSVNEDVILEDKSLAGPAPEAELNKEKGLGASRINIEDESRQEKGSFENEEEVKAAELSTGEENISQSKNGLRKNEGVQNRATAGKSAKNEEELAIGKNKAAKAKAAAEQEDKDQPSLLMGGALPKLQPKMVVVEAPGNESRLDYPIAGQLVPGMEEEDEEKNPKIHNYPSVYLGAGSAVKVSWLLNNKTLYAMERNSLLSAVPSYHSDWYVLYGGRINDKLAFQTDFYLKDVVGQDYKEYRNGQYGQVKDKLCYRSLGLSVSHLGKQIGYGKYPTYVRFTGGIYGGHLQKAEEITFVGTADKTNEYARFHLGALGGYEYDTFLGEHFILSYGLRSRLDLLNIYSGTDHMPAAFRRTRAFSVDFSFSLKYILKK